MLKGVPSCLSPQLLQVLASMGHGDCLGASAVLPPPALARPDNAPPDGHAPSCPHALTPSLGLCSTSDNC